MISPLFDVSRSSSLHAPHDAFIAVVSQNLNMALGPGKGCVVRLACKETKMDGTPVKARHTLSPEIARLVAEHRPGGPLERDFYVAPRGLRGRSGTDFSPPLGLCRLCLPGGAAGRLLHLQGRHRIGHRGARPGRRDPRLPQCLPPSRLAHLQDRAGQCPSPGLPLSPLDLRARRRAGARHVEGVRRRSRRLLAQARRHRERGRPAVHLPRRLSRPTSRRRWPPSGTR